MDNYERDTAKFFGEFVRCWLIGLAMSAFFGLIGILWVITDPMF